MTTPTPNRIPVNIEDEMKRSYMDYAMSVIVGRALPDIRDGLKPAHRRVLYGMKAMGLASNRGYRKCAKIVGEVMGNYHPHGDASIYDTLVRMAQDFNMRYLSAEHWIAIFRTFYGPTHKAFGALPPAGQNKLHEDMVALLESANRGGPASLVVPAEYLEVVVTLK